MLKKIVFIKNNKNRGVATAWNQGIKVAINNGAIFYLVSNSDICYRSDSIDNLLLFAKKSKLGMVTSIDTKRCFNKDYLTFELREETWEGLCWSCFLLQKWVIEKVGYFDENYWPAFCEDLDYEARLNIAGIEKKSTFMSVILHNEGATGRGNSWKLDSSIKSQGDLYYYAHVKNKNYYANKFKIGNKYNKPIPQ